MIAAPEPPPEILDLDQPEKCLALSGTRLVTRFQADELVEYSVETEDTGARFLRFRGSLTPRTNGQP